MLNQEQQLIDRLFSQLKKAELNSGSRDSVAEELIASHLKQQPDAPYYMAQAILIQEAAMKKLNEQMKDLENRLAQQQNRGGFLSGLFGGGHRSAQPIQQPTSLSANMAPAQSQPSYNSSATNGSGFLSGALKTAAGVAGGVVIANMLTDMFHHSQPEEIVNIINEPAMPESLDTSLDTFNQGGQNAFLNQDADIDQNYANNFNDFSDDANFGDDDGFVWFY